MNVFILLELGVCVFSTTTVSRSVFHPSLNKEWSSASIYFLLFNQHAYSYKLFPSLFFVLTFKPLTTKFFAFGEALFSFILFACLNHRYLYFLKNSYLLCACHITNESLLVSYFIDFSQIICIILIFIVCDFLLSSFFKAQHLAPEHKALLIQLLQKLPFSFSNITFFTQYTCYTLKLFSIQISF